MSIIQEVEMTDQTLADETLNNDTMQEETIAVIRLADINAVKMDQEVQSQGFFSKAFTPQEELSFVQM